MRSEEFTIELEGTCLERTSAVLNRPAAVMMQPSDSGRLDGVSGDERDPVILLAHGAGLGKSSPFMEAMAALLVERGFAVMRFNYAYQEKKEQTGGKRPPEKKDVLVATHRAALAALTKRLPGRPVIFAGKSMGSRMGSYLAADGAGCPDCIGLVMFGYPLHPSGKPDKLRIDQFPDLAIPALFLQGTRDKLADLDLLKLHLNDYAGAATVQVIEGADHDFKVLKKQNRRHDQVLAGLADLVVKWVERLAD